MGADACPVPEGCGQHIANRTHKVLGHCECTKPNGSRSSNRCTEESICDVLFREHCRVPGHLWLRGARTIRSFKSRPKCLVAFLWLICFGGSLRSMSVKRFGEDAVPASAR